MIKSDKIHLLLLSVFLFLLVACVPKPYISDSDLQRKVEVAIGSSSDLPQQFRVEVRNGIVRITGSLLCEDCGGNATPGQAGTIQQSIGAVIRAVPGVTRVEFYLNPA